MSTKQKLRFYSILAGNDIRLILAVLPIVQELGDDAALPYLQRLADGQAEATRKDWEIFYTAKHVQAQSRTCLERVKDRILHTSYLQTLVRPSMNSNSGIANMSAHLLRSASGTAHTTPEENTQLLRPAVGQDRIEEHRGTMDIQRKRI